MGMGRLGGFLLFIQYTVSYQKSLLYAFFYLPFEKGQNYNQEANNLLWTVVFVEACSFQMGI